jgi:hypothetical protein
MGRKTKLEMKSSKVGRNVKKQKDTNIESFSFWH